MTARLNQIIAVEKGIKSQSHSTMSEIYKAVQKVELFNGFSKSYSPKDDDGEILPAENKRVQHTAAGVLETVAASLTDLFQITARKDWSNCSAKADIEVAGKVLVAGVPVSHLLFLEKQLTDLGTLVKHLPVLDEGDEWNYDSVASLYKTRAVQTHRTKKTQRPVVLYDATAEHPAQTAMVTEDVLAGYWSTVKHSGAMPKAEKAAITSRVETLLRAVKQAREKANSVEEVTPPDVAGAVFNFLLKKE